MCNVKESELFAYIVSGDLTYCEKFLYPLGLSRGNVFAGRDAKFITESSAKG